MYDKLKKQITFPHTIPMPVLDGKKYTMNDIDGGTVRIADLNIPTNGFWGGNVLVVGMVNALGFYACPSRYDNTIQGFYVHDGSIVTEKGKEVLAKRFPDCTIVYEPEPEVVTQDEADHIKELKAEALKYGLAAQQVTQVSAKELEGLIKAMASGIDATKHIQTDFAVAEPYGEEMTHVDGSGEVRVSAEQRAVVEQRSRRARKFE